MMSNRMKHLLEIFFIFKFCVFPTEDTKAKSDAFAAQNNLPKMEYVLHPRSTGFTFIVDKLRKGQDELLAFEIMQRPYST